jgi:hypothetical protein
MRYVIVMRSVVVLLAALINCHRQSSLAATMTGRRAWRDHPQAGSRHLPGLHQVGCGEKGDRRLAAALGLKFANRGRILFRGEIVGPKGKGPAAVPQVPSMNTSMSGGQSPS